MAARSITSNRRLLRRVRRWIDLLAELVELFLRLRWLVIRLGGAIASLVGIKTRAGAAAAAYRRLPALMRIGRRSSTAVLRINGHVPVLHLAGSAGQMGRQYGRLLRRPLQALSASAYAAAPAVLARRLFALAERAEPHLPDETREEIRAIADEADVPYELLAALNATSRLACTTVAARDADGHVLMGRNADFFSIGIGERAMLVVVRTGDSGQPTVGVNLLGMVGCFTGINAAGVAFGNMVIFNAAGMRHRPEGLPIQIAMRRAAERTRSAGEMAGILRLQNHAAPMNVMVADATSAHVVELALTATATRDLADRPLVATNHFRSAGPAHQASRDNTDYICRRYDRLMSGRGAADGVMTVDDVKRALHQTRVRMMNLQAVVFEPAARRLHVSINRLPASAGPYQLLELDHLLGA